VHPGFQSVRRDRILTQVVLEQALSKEFGRTSAGQGVEISDENPSTDSYPSEFARAISMVETQHAASLLKAEAFMISSLHPIPFWK
jgi:hypothetical protein